MLIEPNKGLDSSTKKIHSLLHLFAKKANQNFYETEFSLAGFSKDPRIKWQVKDNQATGSINAGITKDLYEFLKNELSTFAHHYQNIERVIITADEGAVSIPYRDTGMGD